MKSSSTPPLPVSSPPVFYFPVHGCEPARPLTAAEIEKQQKKCLAAIKQHWDNEGVKAIVQLLEIKAAIQQGRAITREATSYDAGGASALLNVVRDLQAKRWSE